MPNGGQHYFTIAHCPNCGDMRIHMRDGWHLFERWQCRNCREKFFMPSWQEWEYPPNSNGPPKWAIDDSWNSLPYKPYLSVLKREGRAHNNWRE